MARKDYIELAKVIKQTRSDYSDSDLALDAVKRLTKEIAVALKRDNASFDTQRFIEACK